MCIIIIIKWPIRSHNETFLGGQELFFFENHFFFGQWSRGSIIIFRVLPGRPRELLFFIIFIIIFVSWW